MTIKQILNKHSNLSIANVSGYPVDFICKLRKNQVHTHIIQTANNISMPIKSVMEKYIVQKFNERAK